jgi:predicted phage terminase large subunit-like protein
MLATDIRPEHVMAARRELARRSLADFACLVDIPTVPLSDEAQEDRFSVMKLDSLAAHHALLCEKLQAIDSGEIQNLMVLMPPGSAKSTYTDVVFVPWFMSRKPRRHVILASYASEIAEKQGRRARQLIGSRSFHNLTGRTLKADNRAVHQWSLDNGSEFMAGGLLSGLTGNRAALGLIDDPIRGREAAQSETIRNKTWDAYIDDFCSRLIPGAPQVMVLTRWHEDDPAGRILPEGWDGESGWFNGRDGRRWYVVCLPAEADRADDPLGRALGESLWPEWFKPGHWEPFKVYPRTWASLYQQKPKPLQGDIFEVGMLQTVKAIPAGVTQWARGWDFAGSVDGDFTAGVKLGKLADGRFIVADVVRERYLADKRDALIRNTTTADGAGVRVSIPQDPGQAGKTQVLYLTRQLAGYAVHSSPETGDKVTRSEPFAAQVNVGNVLMLEAPWNQAFREELRAFDSGTYDDQVDAASRAFARLLGAPDANPAGIKVQGL